VPHRRRDFFDVDVLAFEDIFEQRTAVDRLRLMRRRVLHVIPPPLDQRHFGRVRRQSQRDIDPRHRRQDVGDYAVALGKARHFVEQQRRVAHLPLIDIDEATDLFFGLGPLDGLELARGFDRAYPVSKVLVGHCNLSQIWSGAGFADGLEFPPHRQLQFCPRPTACVPTTRQ
jgi:hypothetical protein